MNARVLNRPAHQIVDIADAPRFQRVRVKLFGRFMLPNQREYPCEVRRMSPGDAILSSPVDVALNQRIVAYIDEIGRIEGHVIRADSGGFEMTVNATVQRRDKLAAQLTWIANREPLGLVDERNAERRPPKVPIHRLSLPDDDSEMVRVIDVSLSGARVITKRRPKLGTPVMLGRVRAVVARHTEDGVALKFANLLFDDNTF